MAITNGQIDGRAAARRQGRRCQSGRLVRTHAAVGRGRDSQSRPAKRRHRQRHRPRGRAATDRVRSSTRASTSTRASRSSRRSGATCCRSARSSGWTSPVRRPFIRAAQSADVPLMRLLLSKGADPQLTTFNGTTALMAAAGVNWVVGQTYSESPARWLEAVQPVPRARRRRERRQRRWGSPPCTARPIADRTTSSSCWRGAARGSTSRTRKAARRSTWAEGVFLATNSPVAKPSTMALLEEADARRDRPERARCAQDSSSSGRLVAGGSASAHGGSRDSSGCSPHAQRRPRSGVPEAVLRHLSQRARRRPAAWRSTR